MKVWAEAVARAWEANIAGWRGVARARWLLACMALVVVLGAVVDTAIMMHLYDGGILNFQLHFAGRREGLSYLFSSIFDYMQLFSTELEAMPRVAWREFNAWVEGFSFARWAPLVFKAEVGEKYISWRELALRLPVVVILSVPMALWQAGALGWSRRLVAGSEGSHSRSDFASDVRRYWLRLLGIWLVLYLLCVVLVNVWRPGYLGGLEYHTRLAYLLARARDIVAEEGIYILFGLAPAFVVLRDTGVWGAMKQSAAFIVGRWREAVVLLGILSVVVWLGKMCMLILGMVPVYVITNSVSARTALMPGHLVYLIISGFISIWFAMSVVAWIGGGEGEESESRK